MYDNAVLLKHRKRLLTIQLFWYYRHLFLVHRWRFLTGILFLVACNLLGVSVPILIQQAIQSIETHQPQELPRYFWLLALTATIMLGCRIVSRQQLIGLGRLMEYTLRDRLYQHLLTLPQSFYTAHPTGALMSRMINDVQALRYLCGGGSLLGFNTLFAYLITLPVMIHYSPRLTFYAFLLLPLAVFLMSMISGRVKTQYLRVQGVLADVSAIAQENFSGMSVIQSYVKESDESQRFKGVSRQYFQEFSTLVRQRVWLFLVMALITSLGILVVLAEGGREFIVGEINIGVFVAFILLLERLSWPTAAMGWTVTMIQQGSAAMERLHQVFSVRSDLVLDRSKKGYKSPFPQGGLELRNLTFAYPDELPVLKNIDLTLSPGKTYVLVGEVGCGKSTLLSLIPRLYPVPEGTLFIGRRDVNTMPLSALRQIVTYMPQHSFLFSSTIEKNLAYGRPDSLYPDLVKATQTASLHEEIQAFPEQYSTIVGERGVTLSGGQRQRMALARAILLTSRILLLDDPFSNVDAETEEKIINALTKRRMFDDKITLIATHRLSIIQNADAIILMDKGRIVAMDTHERLLESQSFYQKMHRVQTLQNQLETLWDEGAMS